MLNRLSGEEQCEEDRAKGDTHHAVCPLGLQQARPITARLEAAVNRLIADNQARGGPEIEFCDDLAAGGLRPELQAVAFLVVEELLLNACHHSKSKNVLLGLSQDNERVRIQVQDWGIGFDPAGVEPDRLGLQRGLEGVAQLVGRLGGTVDIDSRPGVGTCIVVQIPLLQKTKPANAACGRRAR
ncbi:MAG: ATP-binding protein [Thermoguttaceae bacterium]